MQHSPPALGPTFRCLKLLSVPPPPSPHLTGTLNRILTWEHLTSQGSVAVFATSRCLAFALPKSSGSYGVVRGWRSYSGHSWGSMGHSRHGNTADMAAQPMGCGIGPACISSLHLTKYREVEVVGEKHQKLGNSQMYCICSFKPNRLPYRVSGPSDCSQYRKRLPSGFKTLRQTRDIMEWMSRGAAICEENMETLAFRPKTSEVFSISRQKEESFKPSL